MSIQSINAALTMRWHQMVTGRSHVHFGVLHQPDRLGILHSLSQGG